MDIFKDWFPLLAQIGLMVWWMSRTNTKLEVISDGQKEQKRVLEEHIEEDKEMQKQIQAMAVQEANVGGMLSNLALQIGYIRQALDDRAEDHGELLELKLEKQSNELIIKFRDMLHLTKKEISEEAAKASAEQLRIALRQR